MVEESQLRRLLRLFGWCIVVETLIMIFGVTTAPLLMLLALDAAIGLIVVRSLIEMRPGLRVAFSAVRSGGRLSGR
ncbi:MAG: hypothetical protein JO320_18310 [Alphaproteobacteria bacterium]|nr:hypothetical protein [Alphaproteobacteria bacterium]